MNDETNKSSGEIKSRTSNPRRNLNLLESFGHPLSRNKPGKFLENDESSTPQTHLTLQCPVFTTIGDTETLGLQQIAGFPHEVRLVFGGMSIPKRLFEKEYGDRLYMDVSFQFHPTNMKDVYIKLCSSLGLPAFIFN